MRTIHSRKINQHNRMSEAAFPPIGMGPSVWGPIFWTMMHITTLGYPDIPTDQEKQAAVDFFESLRYTIPCPICKQHYSDNLNESPVRHAVGSKQALIRWLFNIHNKVNEQLKKPQLSWEDFIRQMTNLSQRSQFSFYDHTTQSMSGMTSTAWICLGVGLIAGAGLGYAVVKGGKLGF